MLIGIISDTHDDMKMLRKAVDFLNEKGVGLVLHCGDFCAPFTIEVLRDLEAEFKGIFGNNDGDKLMISELYKGRVTNQPRLLDIEGGPGGRTLKAVMVHEHFVVDALARSGEYDLVFFGHSHQPVIRREGETLLINPGKVARLHKGKSTLALLDTEKMEAEHIELNI